MTSPHLGAFCCCFCCYCCQPQRQDLPHETAHGRRWSEVGRQCEAQLYCTPDMVTCMLVLRNPGDVLRDVLSAPLKGASLGGFEALYEGDRVGAGTPAVSVGTTQLPAHAGVRGSNTRQPRLVPRRPSWQVHALTARPPTPLVCRGTVGTTRVICGCECMLMLGS